MSGSTGPARPHDKADTAQPIYVVANLLGVGADQEYPGLHSFRHPGSFMHGFRVIFQGVPGPPGRRLQPAR